MDASEKKLIYAFAVKDIVLLFAQQELGSECEVDENAILNYINSLKFAFDTFEVTNKEDIYKLITDDILDGLPIWDFLKISDWTKKMIESSYIDRKKKERELLEKTYKCFSCKYFDETFTSIGPVIKCNWKPPVKTVNRYRCFDLTRRDDEFHLKKRCKNFEEKDTTSRE